MARQRATAGLYGLEHSNRRGDELWSKNRFNSSFPMALCCWLRDHGTPALVLEVDGAGAVKPKPRSVPHLWGLDEHDAPFFVFEKAFSPFAGLCADGMAPKADVILSRAVSGRAGPALRALEVKLTVIPDNTTSRLDPTRWGAEIVFRPATIATATLGLYVSAQAHRGIITRALKPLCTRVQNWASHHEALKRLPQAREALQSIVRALHTVQQPLIVQPIWRTDGHIGLAENAFDVFAWTDFAFLQLVLDLAGGSDESEAADAGPKRTQRACLQMARMLYELALSEQTAPKRVFDEMVYGKQSDKAFAISGAVSHKYLAHPRLVKPAIPREALRELFRGDGFQRLEPEKRLDATIRFTCGDLFDNRP